MKLDIRLAEIRSATFTAATPHIQYDVSCQLKWMANELAANNKQMNRIKYQSKFHLSRQQ